MKKLYYATSNNWKFERAKDYFKKLGVDIEQFDIEIPEIRSDSVSEVAKDKAIFAYKKLKKPVFVMDAGFFITALKGFPATNVKLAEKYLGSEGILKLMEDIEDRNWEFPHAVAYKDALIEKDFIGTIKGTISLKLSNAKENKFGRFNDIQIPEGQSKTFSEMSKEELAQFDEEIWNHTVYNQFIKWYKEKAGE